MITSINNDNNGSYTELFERASEILSGYKSVQTYTPGMNYFVRNPIKKDYEEVDLNKNDPNATEDDRIYNFAEYLDKGKVYVQILDEDGNLKAAEGFSSKLGITSLEEYYHWLPMLKEDTAIDKITGEEIKVPSIFTKLPLDEPHFEIKANTRAINIPDEFKKNGVAVQGDDLAEIVYFKIDRYFDAVDLNNTEIYIEWEAPKAKNSKESVKGLSKPYMTIIDDLKEPGKLIFGWALCDDITKEAGSLKFAVRFIQRDINDNIVYSFNTLTAQATIHANLGIDMKASVDQADSCSARLLERIQESEVVGAAKAAVPIFLTDLVNLEDGYDLYKDGEVYHYEGGNNRLYVVAAASDTGAVSCIWKRGELNPDNIPTKNDVWTVIEDKDVFGTETVAITEEELTNKDGTHKLDSKRVYYYRTSADGENWLRLETGYYDLDDVNTVNFFKGIFGIEFEGDYENIPGIPTLYEVRSYLDVKKYGQYQAIARNRIFNSLTKADSTLVTFKRPAPVEFDKTNYTFNKHIIGTESAILAPEVVDAVGALDYKWYYSNEFKSIADEQASDAIGDYEDTGFTTPTLNASIPGYYKLEVTRTRNADSVVNYTDEYRVTEAPQTPEFAKGTFDVARTGSLVKLANQEESLDIAWVDAKDAPKPDEYRVYWYLHYQDPAKTDIPFNPIAVASDKEMKHSFNPFA